MTWSQAGCVCHKVKEMGPFLRHQGNEMNFSFKMGVRFAASLNMGEHFLYLLRLCMKMLGLTYSQYEDKPN